MRDMAAGDGLDMRSDLTRGGNTFDGHRLLQLAAEHGLQTEMKERLMRAYHSEGELISDHETLVRLAGEVGVPEDEAREMLARDRFAAEVREDEGTAPRLGHQRGADLRRRPPHRASPAPSRPRSCAFWRGWERVPARGLRLSCSRRAAQPTSISPPSANGGTSSMRSPLQKRPGSYQLAGRRLGSSPIAW